MPSRPGADLFLVFFSTCVISSIVMGLSRYDACS